MDFLTWLQETDLAQFIATDPYAFPILLCFHAVGMAGVVGMTWVMSLRVLGFAQALSVATFRQMAVIALCGLAINAVSGVLIFASEARRVIINTEFQIKLGCIGLGILAAWLMLRALKRVDESGRFPIDAKVVATVSSLAWLLAIVFGRQIAYTLAPPWAV